MGVITKYWGSLALAVGIACTGQESPEILSDILPDASTDSSEASCLDQLVTNLNCNNPSAEPILKIGVMIDDLSYTISDQEVQEVINAVSLELQQKTHIPAKLHGIQHIHETLPPLNPEGSTSNPIFNHYIKTHENMPNYIILFTGQGTRETSGWAMKSINLCERGFANEFVSLIHGNSYIYGSFIDWTHRFAACGYDQELYLQTGEYHQISDVSLDNGTCINQEGIECVFNQMVNYNVCSNVYDGGLYFRYEKAFLVGTIIHELMHAFGTHQDGDHFGTSQCDTEMNGRYYWGREGPLVTSQEYAGICPYVFQNFTNSFNNNCN